MEKLEYAKFLAASVLYLAHLQRDAAGLIVFDDEVRNFVQPSTRQGQIAPAAAWSRPGASRASARTCRRPFAHLMDFLRRRGIGGR